MANMLQNGAAWFGRQLKAHTGRAVRLVQGDVSLDDLNATLAQVDYDVAEDSGFMTRVQSHDWTLVAADLDGLALRSGALIIETINGVESRYEAMPLGKRKCVESFDTSGVLLTLHTRKVL